MADGESQVPPHTQQASSRYLLMQAAPQVISIYVLNSIRWLPSHVLNSSRQPSTYLHILNKHFPRYLPIGTSMSSTNSSPGTSPSSTASGSYPGTSMTSASTTRSSSTTTATSRLSTWMKEKPQLYNRPYCTTGCTGYKVTKYNKVTKSQQV